MPIPGREFCQSDGAVIADTCAAAGTVTLVPPSKRQSHQGALLSTADGGVGGFNGRRIEGARDRKITSAIVQLVPCGNIPCLSTRLSEVLWPLGNQVS